MTFKRWLSEWQAVTDFQQLPSLPGIIAISESRKHEVLYITKLSSLRSAEDCTCQFGNVATLLSVLLPDFRISYWTVPPDEVVSAQLGSLVEKLINEVQPRLNQIPQSETKTPPKALPVELIEPDSELLV